MEVVSGGGAGGAFDAEDLRSSSDDDRRAAYGTSIPDKDALDVAASDDVTLRLSEGR